MPEMTEMEIDDMKEKYAEQLGATSFGTNES